MVRSSIHLGYRFHPSDEELVMYFLKKKLLGRKISSNAVTEVNIYDFSPRDLPDKSSLRNGELEWYFFSPKSKKYSSGSRLNRATENGFWKATGRDKKVTHKGRTVATIKTLVFHLGHAGSGQRTDWVMHEYKMEDEQLANAGVVQDMYVLCKIFKKSGWGPKNGAQYCVPFNEEEWDDDVANCSGSQTVVDPNTVDHKQKGPAATMNMTVPRKTGSLYINEPGSSAVTYSPNENTICKVTEKSGPRPKNGGQYGAPFNEEERDDDVANCSGSQAVVDPNTVDHKQHAPAATMNMTVPRITGSLYINEPGPSAVTYFPNENTTNTLNNNCNNKLKGPVMTVSVNKPGSSSLSFSLNERYVDVPPPDNEDMMLFKDRNPYWEPSPEDILNGNNENQGVEVAKSVSPNKVDDGIYDELDNFFNLDDLNGEIFKTDGAAAAAVGYTFDEMLRTDDLDADLREFYVD